MTLNLSDDELKATAERFQRFADNWYIPRTRSALKMFLACGLDTAMHKTGQVEVPDAEWETLFTQVLAHVKNVWVTDAPLL